MKNFHGIKRMDAKDFKSRKYNILSITDIKQRQADAINNVSTVLSISKPESCILLRRYNWNVNQVQERWFDDEHSVRKAVGLPVIEPAENQKAAESMCGICLDIYNQESMAAAACGAHWYCTVCWKAYVEAAIGDGPGCLGLRCPDPSCWAVVSFDMINNFASDKERERYVSYLFRSYVDDNQSIKWCPSPGCEYAAEFFVSGLEGNNVRCNCLHCFCWDCSEESHHPMDCKTAAEWRTDMPEVMSKQWISCNTKPCPNCARPIEKFGYGCSHMKCIAPCGYHFCWDCLEHWDEDGHGSRDCKKVKTGHNGKDDLGRSLLKRWASNNTLKLKALNRLRRSEWDERRDLPINNLFDSGFSDNYVEFIGKAWEQIVDCRETLEWTYVYEYYYMEGDENGKKPYFKYTQGLAEEVVEKLYQCAEKEGNAYFEAEGPTVGFYNYCTKLVALTSAARKIFNNLIRALDTGLSEVGREQPVGQNKRKLSDDAEAGTSALCNNFIQS